MRPGTINIFLSEEGKHVCANKRHRKITSQINSFIPQTNNLPPPLSEESKMSINSSKITSIFSPFSWTSSRISWKQVTTGLATIVAMSSTLSQTKEVWIIKVKIFKMLGNILPQYKVCKSPQLPHPSHTQFLCGSNSDHCNKY